jgi:hypothetical protein
MLSRYVLFAFLSSILTLSSASAALIPLTSTWTPAPNKAPPYYIWQNDPQLTEYLNQNGVTGLCVPAAISNAVLYEFAFKAKRATGLKIPGIMTDGATGNALVDSNAMIRYFARTCGYQNGVGTSLVAGAECIAQFYQDSGYPDAQVKMIRKNVPSNANDVEFIDRLPTTDDIAQALEQKYEVIASVVTMNYDVERARWIKVGSHSFNIYGIQGQTLTVSNPTRAYRMNFIDPVFDTITFDSASFGSGVSSPDSYSSIRLVGRLIGHTGATTFLAGLTLIRPE